MDELVSARTDGPESYGARFRESMRGALRVVLDLALPQLCPSCREPVSEGKGLCAPCWSKLSLIEPPYCMRLGIPFAYDLGLACCQRSPIHRLTTVRAVARYNDVASTLVHGLKYSDRLDLSPMMADAHWRRRWARRYINRPFLPAQYRRFAGSLSRTAAQTYPCHTAAGRPVSNRARR
jgi:predicted amidophosphoribosyltransferase